MDGAARSRGWFLNVVLALASSLGAVGCGGRPGLPPPPGYQRLPLTSSVTPSEANPIVHTWVPSADAPPSVSGGAQGDVRTMQLVRTTPGRRDPHSALVVERPAKGWMVPIPIPDDVPWFNEVTVECESRGKTFELSVVEYVVAGKVVRVSPSQMLHVTGQVERHTVSFPEARWSGDGRRQIRVHFAGRAELVAITGIHLSQRPWESFLPASDGTEMHKIGSIWRRAVGLTAKSKVELGPLHVPAGAVLSFHVALESSLHKPQDRVELELTVEPERGGKAITRTFEAERAKDPAWEKIELRFDEDVVGNGAIRIKSPDAVAYALAADPMVSSRADAPPTVVFITSDTHRADHMGYVGAPSPVSTPNLDALSRRGVRFLDCFAACTSTNPSHISMMTGTSPRDTRIVNNEVELAKRARTLAESFGDAGYRTVAVVSAPHLTPGRSGLGQGFDRFEGSETEVPDAEDSVAAALEQLREAEGLPVFLWLHLFDAHSPYGPPEPFDRKYYPKDKDPRAPELSLNVLDDCVPTWLDGVRDRDYLYAQYRAEVDYLDNSLGSLLSQPRVRDGIVAFTADHGESFGQHGIFWTHAGVYPDTVRVPLILTWPGAPQLVEVKEPTESVDIGRTLLDLAGATAVPFPGRDLRWALEESPERQPRFAFDGHFHSASITAQDWLLILHLKNHRIPGESIWRDFGEVELFDLKNDPDCTRNLVIDELDRAKLMREKLIEWLSQADPVGLAAGEADLTGEERALLTQLGYADTDDALEGEPIWNPERHHKDFGRSPWSRLFYDKNIDPEKFRPRIEASMYKDG